LNFLLRLPKLPSIYFILIPILYYRYLSLRRRRRRRYIPPL